MSAITIIDSIIGPVINTSHNKWYVILLFYYFPNDIMKNKVVNVLQTFETILVYRSTLNLAALFKKIFSENSFQLILMAALFSKGTHVIC